MGKVSGPALVAPNPNANPMTTPNPEANPDHSPEPLYNPFSNPTPSWLRLSPSLYLLPPAQWWYFQWMMDVFHLGNITDTKKLWKEA